VNIRFLAMVQARLILSNIFTISMVFWAKLHLISHEGTVMIHTTSANIFIYSQVKSTPKAQIEARIENREKE